MKNISGIPAPHGKLAATDKRLKNGSEKKILKKNLGFSVQLRIFRS
jgi:hypothetical protein